MYFRGLPLELLTAIASHCSPATQAALCLTSKQMFNVFLPWLYDDVDLSVHDMPELSPVGMGPSSIMKVPGILEPKILQVRRAQRRFLDILESRPQLGALTHRLKWTFGVESPFPYKSGKINPPHVEKYHEALKFLTSIRMLDIGCLPNSCDQWIQHTIFKGAISIRLLGQMSQKVFQTIFESTSRTALESLTLDNLSFIEATGTRDIDSASPALGHLRRLQDAFPSLKNVTIRLCGNDDNSYYWNGFNDNRRYAEVGSFLRSVSPTIEHLVFEHGPFEEEHEPQPPRCGNPYLRHQDRVHDRPMDVLFREHILPLFQQSETWPKLQSLELRGAGQWIFHQSEALARGSRMREIDSEIVKGIKIALPSVAVTVALENSRFFTAYGYIPSIGYKVAPRWLVHDSC